MIFRPLVAHMLAGAIAIGAAQAEPGPPTARAVLETYADIAEAAYGDSLTTARRLSGAVAALIAAPSDATLSEAREAWKAARVPYQQSEVFRFGNPIVDAWEGKVNAWPLDEGLIDYVDTSTLFTDENDYADLNIIANPIVSIAGRQVDASVISPALISEMLNEADGIETNVARGYHAIEFLLWGQDLNGTGPGAGARPATDYLQGEGCTGGHCDRRAAYLRAATDLLVADLEEMAANWAAGGAARSAVMADEAAGLKAILTGMGSLSYGEQAGDRMRLGLMLNDPEEEHDCFSDNTHWSHFYNGLGTQNVYLGHYTRVDGQMIDGASLSDLVAVRDPALDAEMRTRLATTIDALQAIVDAAQGGLAYDQMLAMGNAEGEALIMAGIDALVDQTRSIERVVGLLGLTDITVDVPGVSPAGAD